LKAKNKYVGEEHRHRTLYASIETSVRYLDTELADLFSRLWLFHAPFLPETAVVIFDPEHGNTKVDVSQVYDKLYTLWRRGLLVHEEATLREGTIQFYYVLPTIRPYIEKYLARANEREPLLEKFGAAYAVLIQYLFDELDRGGVSAFVALQAREDLERGVTCVAGVAQGYYLLYWGWVLQRLGNTSRGLKLIEQALEIGQGQDRRLEVLALNNMAAVYQATGQPRQALELFEQTLSLMREVRDRAGEATTLGNMATVYQATGQHRRALELFEQALPLIREVGDRAGEATILNGMAVVYQKTGQPQLALELYEQALSLRREVGDRAGEALTLTGLAYLYQSMQRYRDAQAAFEQSIVLSQQIFYPAVEVAGLVRLALLLYRHLSRPQEAIAKMEQAIAVLVETDLPQDAAGKTRDDMQHYLDAMRQGLSLDQANSGPATIPSDPLQWIVSNTVAVMTTVPDRRAKWREAITELLRQAKSSNLRQEADFFTAVLAVLNGESPVLPGDHPYALTLAQIQEGIAAGELEDDDTQQGDDLPFDAELIPRSIAALFGGPQEKMAHVQYLTVMSTQTADEGLKALLQVIQLGLFGSDLPQLGQNLSGVYRQAWEAIVVGVESGGVDPRLFGMIVQNTLAVLGPAADKRSDWHEALMQMRSQAVEGEAQEFVALVDTVIGLLDAGGNPDGLGMSLKGVYARTWQVIVEQLA
jgi:tetratricopeptide (TPR) repeat protein